MSNTSVLLCPCCDKSIEPGSKMCPQCNQPIVVNAPSLASMEIPLVNKYLKGYSKALSANPDNQELNGYAAMCFLRLKLYDKAFPLFEKAVDCNYESAEPYFMAAICLMRGKKPFLAQRADIDKAVKYLNAANMIEPKAIHFRLLAYIKQDYFDRKYLNVSPSSQEELAHAIEAGLTQKDETTLEMLLKG